MEQNMFIPKNATALDEEQMMDLNGGSWSYRGHSWNDTPLYALVNSRSEIAFGTILAKFLVKAISVTISLYGPVGKIVGKMFGSIVKTNSNIFDNKEWTKAVQYCFQDGLHSNLYVTTYMKGNNIISYGSEWLYTN